MAAADRFMPATMLLHASFYVSGQTTGRTDRNTSPGTTAGYFGRRLDLRNPRYPHRTRPMGAFRLSMTTLLLDIQSSGRLLLPVAAGESY